MQKIVFDALYIKNTGAIPKGAKELPITLRREDNVFQNVMLVLGEVNKSDLIIKQKQKENRFEENQEEQQVFLKMHNKEFQLTLPMINYFQDLIDGSIVSNLNPTLTHGIATLDAILLDVFGDKKPANKEDCEIKVIINTTKGQEMEMFSFDNEFLSIL